MPHPSMTPESRLTEPFQKAVAELVKKHNFAVASLTEVQLVDAVLQAFRSGDFIRHVTADGFQSVTYIPLRRVEELQARIRELEETVAKCHAIYTEKP